MCECDGWKMRDGAIGPTPLLSLSLSLFPSSVTKLFPRFAVSSLELHCVFSSKTTATRSNARCDPLSVPFSLIVFVVVAVCSSLSLCVTHQDQRPPLAYPLVLPMLQLLHEQTGC